MRRHFKDRFSESHLRLATVPSKAELMMKPNEMVAFPIVKYRNIFVLPGVPKFLKYAFHIIEDQIKNLEVTYHSSEIYLSCDEMSIASKLSEINEEFKQTVTLGSYPEWHSNYYKVKLVLESESKDRLGACRKRIVALLPANVQVPYEKHPRHQSILKIHALLAGSEDGQFVEKVKASIVAMKEALRRYKPHEICIGFNGGKDCTALLHLW